MSTVPNAAGIIYLGKQITFLNNNYPTLKYLRSKKHSSLIRAE